MVPAGDAARLPVSDFVGGHWRDNAETTWHSKKEALGTQMLLALIICTSVCCN